jgi:trigger factor
MNIVRKDIDNVNALVTVKISKTDYQEKFEKTLQEYRRKANIPGFRPGMVPVGLVKKMYGKAILAEEVNKLVSDGIYNYIKENNIQILGEPLPNETEQPSIDFDAQEEFDFVFDLGIAPEFELKLDKKDKIKSYQIVVSDEMIQNQVNSYVGRFGSYIQVDTVEEKDVVKGDLLEMGADKKVNESGIKVEAGVLTPAYIKDKKQKKSFVGAKIGDVIVFNPQSAFENESEISSLLKVSKDEAKKITADFMITITGITRYQEAEINQVLFDKVFGEGVVASEEEFQAKIKENIQENLQADSDYKFTLDAQKYLVKKLSDVVFPEAFLKRWVVLTNKNLTEEAVEKDFPAMLDDLKWHLIKDKLSKENNVKVEAVDIEEYAKKIAKSQFAQYGMANVPDDILDGYVKDMLKKEESVRNIVDKVVESKAMEVVKAAVKLEMKEVSIEEFNKMFEA